MPFGQGLAAAANVGREPAPHPLDGRAGGGHRHLRRRGLRPVGLPPRPAGVPAVPGQPFRSGAGRPGRDAGCPALTHFRAAASSPGLAPPVQSRDDMKKINALAVIGTRPEAIKMAPVVRALRATGRFDVHVLFTGQHRGLLDQAAADFGLVADADLDLMRPDQGLASLTARLLEGIDAVLASRTVDVVLGAGRHHHGAGRRDGRLLPADPLRPRRGRPADREHRQPVPGGGQSPPGRGARQHPLRPHARRALEPARRGRSGGPHRGHREHRDRRPARRLRPGAGAAGSRGAGRPAGARHAAPAREPGRAAPRRARRHPGRHRGRARGPGSSGRSTRIPTSARRPARSSPASRASSWWSRRPISPSCRSCSAPT